jgi:hypothetical protein
VVWCGVVWCGVVRRTAACAVADEEARKTRDFGRCAAHGDALGKKRNRDLNCAANILILGPRELKGEERPNPWTRHKRTLKFTCIL